MKYVKCYKCRVEKNVNDDFKLACKELKNEGWEKVGNQNGFGLFCSHCKILIKAEYGIKD